MLAREDFEAVSRTLSAANGEDPDEMVRDKPTEKPWDVHQAAAHVVEPGPDLPLWTRYADSFLEYAASLRSGRRADVP